MLEKTTRDAMDNNTAEASLGCEGRNLQGIMTLSDHPKKKIGANVRFSQLDIQTKIEQNWATDIF